MLLFVATGLTLSVFVRLGNQRLSVQKLAFSTEWRGSEAEK